MGESPEGDLVALAASSQARAFAKLRCAMPVVSIGPHTTREARRVGLDVAAQAERPDAESVAAAISTLPGAWPGSSPS